MSALVKTINLKECPMLSNWIDDEEGYLCAYLLDMQQVIPDLLAAQANLSPDKEEFEIVGHAARVLGCLAHDMEAIRKEVFE